MGASPQGHEVLSLAHSTLHIREGIKGFLLVELLPALLLSTLLLGSLATIVTAVTRVVSHQDRKIRARQALVACMCLIVRDIRMAGCNPWSISSLQGFEPDPDGDGKGNDLLVRFDRRGKGRRSFPDGDIDDPDEEVVYEWDAEERTLRRNNQPMALEIVANRNLSDVFDWQGTGDAVLVTVTLTAALSKEGETFSLATNVSLRNPP